MKLAIVHDYLNQRGGAERVLEIFHEIFPLAPIYTSIFIPEDTFPGFKDLDVRTSFMQKLPFLKQHFKKYLLLYPRAFESFDLSEYEVVLSSSSAFAKGIKLSSRTLHICYCHTPARFIWMYDAYLKRENLGGIVKWFLPYFIAGLKKWDLDNSRRINYFIANSALVAKRIREFYGREATVIYPPVETALYKPAGLIKDYFLIVSRLVSYKRIDIAVEAFNRLGWPLKIVGRGPDLANLKKLASPQIEFLINVSDNELLDLYSGCRALIFTGLEDFGLTPLEAQASGRPVIAFGAGGALETILEGQTGLFFQKQNVDSLVEAVKKFETLEFDKEKIRTQAAKFDREIFKKELRNFIFEKYREFSVR